MVNTVPFFSRGSTLKKVGIMSTLDKKGNGISHENPFSVFPKIPTGKEKSGYVE